MNERVTIVSVIWLEVLRAQRPVSYFDVKHALEDISDARLGPALAKGYRLGYFERSGRLHHYRYSVTPRCNVPPGVPVLEVLEAVS